MKRHNALSISTRVRCHPDKAIPRWPFTIARRGKDWQNATCALVLKEALFLTTL